MLRPVTLSVHVYAVRMEREADYGFGLAALVKELFGTSAELAVSPESVAIVRPSAAVGNTLAATVRALTPLALPGRWRTSTSPAVAARSPSRARRNASAGSTPRPAEASIEIGLMELME